MIVLVVLILLIIVSAYTIGYQDGRMAGRFDSYMGNKQPFLIPVKFIGSKDE